MDELAMSVSAAARVVPLLASLLVALLALTPGCDVVTPEGKDSLPTDHVVEIGGAYHKHDPTEPYRAPGHCAAYGCHHANLQGGWARIIDSRTHETRITESPSCYQCHDRLWNERYPELIEILYPTSDVVWHHGTSRPIEWWGPRTDSVAIYLYADFMLVDTLLTMRPSDGVTRIDAVDPAWGTGRDYRVRIVQSSGHQTFGEVFSICEEPGVIVTRPAPGTVVLHGESLNVEWQCAAGVTVDIFIHATDGYLDVYQRGAGNGGFAGRLVPASWGSGTGYRIQVVDAEGASGFSEAFEIREPD